MNDNETITLDRSTYVALIFALGCTTAMSGMLIILTAWLLSA